MQELLGGRGQGQLLGTALEARPGGFDFVQRGLVPEPGENGCHVAVGGGNAETLGGDGRACGIDDNAVLHPAPQLQGLLLALFLLTTDVGYHVVHHLRPGFEGLARTGDGLIGADQHLLQAEGAQGMEGGDIALQGTVGLDGDKAALRSQTPALGFDDPEVLGIDLRHHHGHVGRPAVGGVIGDHGAPAAGISLLQGLNFLLLHVHRGEYEVHLGGNPVDVCFRVEHHHVLGLPGHGDIQGPAATNGLLVGLARRAAAGRDGGQLKPGVVLQKGNEALTDHAGAADDANSVLFHNQYLRRSIISYSRSSLFETGKMRTFI